MSLFIPQITFTPGASPPPRGSDRGDEVLIIPGGVGGGEGRAGLGNWTQGLFPGRLQLFTLNLPFHFIILEFLPRLLHSGGAA